MHFKSNSVVEGVAPGLLDLIEQVLAAYFAVLILHRHIHLVENAQVVEALLRLHHRALAERISVANLEFAIHDKRLRPLQAGDQHTIDEHLVPFVNLEDHICRGVFAR